MKAFLIRFCFPTFFEMWAIRTCSSGPKPFNGKLQSRFQDRPLKFQVICPLHVPAVCPKRVHFFSKPFFFCDNTYLVPWYRIKELSFTLRTGCDRFFSARFFRFQNRESFFGQYIYRTFFFYCSRSMYMSGRETARLDRAVPKIERQLLALSHPFYRCRENALEPCLDCSFVLGTNHPNSKYFVPKTGLQS